jgi:hypothetical protein
MIKQIKCTNQNSVFFKVKNRWLLAFSPELSNWCRVNLLHFLYRTAVVRTHITLRKCVTEYLAFLPLVSVALSVGFPGAEEPWCRVSSIMHRPGPVFVLPPPWCCVQPGSLDFRASHIDPLTRTANPWNN